MFLHMERLCCLNILPGREDSKPQEKIMFIKDAKKTYFKAVKTVTKISFPGNLPPAG